MKASLVAALGTDHFRRPPSCPRKQPYRLVQSAEDLKSRTAYFPFRLFT